jgi:hypothetical protein
MQLLGTNHLATLMNSSEYASALMQARIFICKDVHGSGSCTTCPALRSCHGTGFDAPKNPVPVIPL